MEDILLLFAVVAAGLIIATPLLTVYLLIRQRKLRSQVEEISYSLSDRNDSLRRELAELKQDLARIIQTAPASVPPVETQTPVASSAERVVEAAKAAPPESRPVSIPSAPVAIAPPTQPKFCYWCGTVHAGGTENCPKAAPASKEQQPASVAGDETKEVVRQPSIGAPSQPVIAAPVPPTPKPPAPRITQPYARVTATPTVDSFRTSEQPSAAQRMKSLFALEETLGKNWLNKLGITLLVLGIALFGIYEIGQTGPLGKVGASYAVALILLGGGIFLERRETYRLLGHTLIGGGWALLFFTTYAIQHVDAMRVLSSETTDLILMLVVALAMVGHTLRYRSQLVTGLSFLLAYSTVALSHDNVYSLAAGVILAIGLVSIVLAMGWFELEVFGILASYLNHLYWLYRLLGPEGAHGHVFPEYNASTALLFFYWIVYRISYVVRRISSTSDERFSTAAALVNTLLLLVTMKFQSVHPELAFYALLVIGAVEFTSGQLPITKRRRQAFVVLTVLGAALMAAAVPFRYSGNDVSILWLVGGEVLLIAGVMFGEVVFRRLGLLAGLLVAGHLIIADFMQLVSTRQASDAVVLNAGVMFALCAVVFYANALFVAKRWVVFLTWPDAQLVVAHSYIAAFAATSAAWALFSGAWLAVAWIGVAVALALLMRQVRYNHLAVQANLITICAVARTFIFNYALPQKTSLGISLRMLTVCIVAAGLYFLSRKAIIRESEAWRPVAYLHTFAATGLLALLAWYEAPGGWVVAIWAGFALVLAIVDRRFKLEEFSWQAHILSAITLIRALSVNLQLTDTWHGVSVRLLSLAIVTVVFYSLARVARMPEDWQARDIPHVYSWAASSVVALLMWYELQPLSVAVGWALLGLALFEYGLLRDVRQFKFQAYVALTGAFARIFFVNLTAGAPGEIWGPRMYTVLPITLILFFVYSQSGKESQDRASSRLPALMAYMGTASIAAILYFQFPDDWLATAWAVVVFALFALALWLDRPIFLHQALLLTVFACARGVLYNLFGTSYFTNGTWTGRYGVLGSAIAIMFGCLPLAFQVRERVKGRDPKGNWLSAIARRPEQVMFFAPVVLLTLMLALKMRAGMVTVSWGIEGVLIILLALAVNERSYRLTGLSLLLLCVGKILARDAWGLAPRDRYITFVILGAALILVNFLYIKYSDAIRKLL